MLDVVFGQQSDPGKIRSNNEDAMGAFVPRTRQEARSRGWLFVVADGVGGMDFGEVASTIAVEKMLTGFAQSPESTSLPSLMPRLVQHANAAVHDEGLQPGRRGRPMATTVVACALRHDKATVAHVGDSRCYHARNGKVELLTQDHSWVAEQQRLGLITAAEAQDSEKRHILTRSLGPELFVTPDTRSVTLQAGDLFVLCTDGLYNGLCDEDIARIASQQKDIDSVAQELVKHAIRADGADNATVQVVEVRSVAAMGMYRGRPYPLSIG
jgi:serine/threonine protein phosphatase PrpC